MTSKKNLKIGLVCDDSLDRPDGVQQFVVTLGEWLRKQGHEVHYLTSETKRVDLKNLHVLSKNFEVKFNGNRLRPPLPASPRLVRDTLNKTNFDVVHIQMPYSPLLAGQIIHYANKKTAIVGTFHILPDSKLVENSSKLLGFVMKPQLNKFDSFSSTSKPTREFMLQTYRKNSQIIPNMIDVSKFSVNINKHSDIVRLVFLGRLVERKGARYLAEAINHMRKIGLPQNKFEVVIGGKGPLAEDISAYIQDNALTSLINLCGFVAEDEKPRFLANSDIIVLPSTGGESFGISVIEAMAATRGAVIAGDNPGYSSVIGQHRAQIIDPKDTDTFAHTLAKFIDNEDLRDDARKWQTDDVKQYDIDNVGRQFEKFYYSALH